MNVLAILIIVLVPIISYAMEEIPLLSREKKSDQSIYHASSSSSSDSEEGDACACTLDGLEPSEWKKNSKTLNWSRRHLTSIDGFKAKCVPSTSSAPPSFPFASLTTIILAHNKLKTIDVSEFSLCSNLQHLDLSHNEISKLTYKTMQEPQVSANLRSLNLAHNNNSSINIGALFNLYPHLKHVDLSHNSISKVSWSPHKVWTYLDIPSDDKAQLPVINLIGNTIDQSDREWLVERYKQEKERFKQSINDAASVECCCIMGTALSLPISIPIAIIVSPFALLATPIGLIAGLGGGLADTRIEGHDTLHPSSALPLYFDEHDQQHRGVSDQITARINLCQWSMCH